MNPMMAQQAMMIAMWMRGDAQNPMMAQQVMTNPMMAMMMGEDVAGELRKMMIKRRMLEMLLRQGMDPVSAMKKVEEMGKNIDDGDFKVEEALGSPKKRLENYLKSQWSLCKKKLQVQVDFGNVPLEWEYLNQYHGIQHPLAMTRFAQKYGLPGAPPPTMTYGT